MANNVFFSGGGSAAKPSGGSSIGGGGFVNPGSRPGGGYGSYGTAGGVGGSGSYSYRSPGYGTNYGTNFQAGGQTILREIKFDRLSPAKTLE